MRRWTRRVLGIALGIALSGGARTAPPGEAGIGLARPLQLVAAAPDGRWVLYCQGPGPAGATAEDPGGETFALRLAGEDGRARPLRADALVALDPGGHRAVLRRADTLVLLDLWTSREESLGVSPWTRGTASGHADGYPYASFDGEGRLLLYPRAGDGRPVVRDLRTGASFVVDTTAPAVLDPGGDWVWVWPDVPLFTPPRGVHEGLCSRPPPGYAWLPPALPGATLVAVAEPHRKQDADGVVAVLGQALLLRDTDGALHRLEGDQDSLVAPASCGARLQHLDAASGQVIVSCGEDQLLANRGGASIPIEGAFPHAGTQDSERTGRWLTVLGWDAVDTVTLSRLPLGEGQRLGLAAERRALILSNGEAPSWRDLDTGESRVLPAVVAPSEVPPAGDWLAMRVGMSEGLLWNVAANAGRALQGVPLAVTAQGRVLLGVGKASGVEGPLWWEDAGALEPPLPRP